jgi:hypothetical protein
MLIDLPDNAAGTRTLFAAANRKHCGFGKPEAFNLLGAFTCGKSCRGKFLVRHKTPTRLEHEKSRAELKCLMPEDAKEAIGHGIRVKRSKAGAISFDLLEVEG